MTFKPSAVITTLMTILSSVSNAATTYTLIDLRKLYQLKEKKKKTGEYSTVLALTNELSSGNGATTLFSIALQYRTGHALAYN